MELIRVTLILSHTENFFLSFHVNEMTQANLDTVLLNASNDTVIIYEVVKMELL